ncbi:LysE family translocator [Profundibacter amoris]|uniref:LysE family translocator n=1 Tax=Profundibacter amoris TaxID=2171755 RepID=A0A347UJ49_9RHOB|nr:LysE family translocator [Profundibacter amoris]AXX98877.1 LysE family translocator [Profundibacter amoris]
MFDYTLLHWTGFLTAAVVLNLAPGPDIAFILGQTVRGGRKTGFAAMAGIWTGAFGHVLMAAAGLSVILATSAMAFSVVKWVGAAYLIWLGIQALRSDGSGFIAEGIKGSAKLMPIYRQGVVVALLNPKVAIFFLAFLPQFVVPDAGPVWAQLFLHGSLIIVVAAFIEPPLILAGERLTNKLRSSPKFGLWLDRSLGAILVALGLRLAMEQR